MGRCKSYYYYYIITISHLVHDTLSGMGVVGPLKFSKIPVSDHNVHLKILHPPSCVYDFKNSLLTCWQVSDFPLLSSIESILSVGSYQNVATFILCLSTFWLDVWWPDPLWATVVKSAKNGQLAICQKKIRFRPVGRKTPPPNFE